MDEEISDVLDVDTLAQWLPAYDFEAFVAQGGMGAIYKARQRSLDRDVAIKILPREFGEDAEFRKSFEIEAKAMARLNHPNLIGVYDFGDLDGLPYIVMEFVNGKSLFHSAYNLAVDPVQAVEIVHGICNGLAHAHENGVIHRDIKPANILLTPKAVPKIGDFGLARPTEGDQSGMVMGTPGYAAPEVTEDPDKADRRSDLFALGVVLYELLIGRCPPYESTPPPSSLSSCDPALDKICEKAMHPNAALRYASAEEMSAALGTWLKKAAATPIGHRQAGARRLHHHETHAHGHAHAQDHASHPAHAQHVPKPSGIPKKKLLAIAAVIALAIPAWTIFLKKIRHPVEVPAATEVVSTDIPLPELPAGQPVVPAKSEAKTSEPSAAAPPVVGAASPAAEPIIAASIAPIPKPENAGKPETPPALPAAPVSAEILELDQKAAALLTDLDETRGKELEANAMATMTILEESLGSLSPEEGSRSAPLLAMLKANVRDHRVPRFAENVEVVQSFKDNLQRLRAKETAIDQTFQSKAVKIRDAYLGRLKTAVAKIQNASERETLTERARNAANIDTWTAKLGLALKYQKPATVLALTDPVVGRWKWFNGHVATFRADGTGSDGKMECAWKIASGSDRPYELSWSSGKFVDQVTISPDANGLNGKNQNGDVISGTRIVE